MKIAIIGAGNVGALSAMRICQYGLGEVVMVDIAAGLAKGKALDLADCRALLKADYRLYGGDDFQQIKGADITVITAGLARKPGMTREDLLHKNAEILKGLCLTVKEFAPNTILVVVTNPLDIMARLALSITGFDRSRVLGMGGSLDASRFANLIAEELKVSPAEIDACVIASHGEGMLPLASATKVRGKPLDKLLPEAKIKELIKKTVGRGAEIVSHLGAGSAYFAPSAAVADLVKAIAHNERRTIAVSVFLDGEYGCQGACAGVPCVIGQKGIEKIIELPLNKQEMEAFNASCANLKKQFSALNEL